METKTWYNGVPFSARSFCGVSFDGNDGWMTHEELPQAETAEMQEIVNQMNEFRQELISDGALENTDVPGYGGVHTWDDWEAYWTDVSIGSPDVEKYTIPVPGRHGVVDLSEVLTGFPVFHNREISVSLAYPGSGAQWHEEFSDMLAQLHGQSVQMVMDSDPAYYYEGRCEVGTVRQDGTYSTFDITMDAYPYKKEVMDSFDDWLWDPLNFESGVIREYGKLLIPAGTTPTSDLTFTIYGSQMPCELWMRASDGQSVVISLQGEGTNGITARTISDSWEKVEFYDGVRKTWLKDHAYQIIIRSTHIEDAYLSIFLRGGKR